MCHVALFVIAVNCNVDPLSLAYVINQPGVTSYSPAESYYKNLMWTDCPEVFILYQSFSTLPFVVARLEIMRISLKRRRYSHTWCWCEPLLIVPYIYHNHHLILISSGLGTSLQCGWDSHSSSTAPFSHSGHRLPHIFFLCFLWSWKMTPLPNNPPVSFTAWSVSSCTSQGGCMLPSYR